MFQGEWIWFAFIAVAVVPYVYIIARTASMGYFASRREATRAFMNDMNLNHKE